MHRSDRIITARQYAGRLHAEGLSAKDAARAAALHYGLSHSAQARLEREMKRAAKAAV